MTLEYRIVVIDDQPNSIRTAVSSLASDIELEGFDVATEYVSTADGVTQLANRTDLSFDLILVDKNLGLGDGEDGATVLRRLRARVPHVPVLFYSGDSASSLRTRIANEAIDGVFCGSRVQMRFDAMSIFRAQSRNLLRPQTVRGLFVGGVSELEHQLREAVRLCTVYLEDPGAQYLKSEAVTQLTRWKETLESEIEAIKAGASTDEILDGSKLQSGQILSILKGLLKTFPDQRISGGFADVLDRFLEEVIQPRNVLAHGKRSNCGKFVELGKRKLKLDAATAREHSSALKRHYSNVTSIIAYVNSAGVVDRATPVAAAAVPIPPDTNV